LLICDDLIDLPSLKWLNEEEDQSDVFAKVFVRIVEYKFAESEHDTDETKDFMSKYNIVPTFKRILEHLADEELIESYKEEISAHEVIYNLLELEA